MRQAALLDEPMTSARDVIGAGGGDPPVVAASVVRVLINTAAVTKSVVTTSRGIMLPREQQR